MSLARPLQRMDAPIPNDFSSMLQLSSKIDR